MRLAVYSLPFSFRILPHVQIFWLFTTTFNTCWILNYDQVRLFTKILEAFFVDRWQEDGAVLACKVCFSFYWHYISEVLIVDISVVTWRGCLDKLFLASKTIVESIDPLSLLAHVSLNALVVQRIQMLILSFPLYVHEWASFGLTRFFFDPCWYLIVIDRMIGANAGSVLYLAQVALNAVLALFLEEWL